MSLRDTPDCSCRQCVAFRREHDFRLNGPPVAPSPLILGGLRCVEVYGKEELLELNTMGGRASDYVRTKPPTWESRLEFRSANVSVEWIDALVLGQEYRVTVEKE